MNLFLLELQSIEQFNIDGWDKAIEREFTTGRPSRSNLQILSALGIVYRLTEETGDPDEPYYLVETNVDDFEEE